MPAEQQLALSFERQHAINALAGELVEFLRGRGWMTAREICAHLQWSDRAVRDAASSSDEVISYPGSPGYKLLKDCSKEEYDRYRDARRSQARDMIGKVIRTDRIFYARRAAT
jgi:hypothetical protein